MLFADRIRKIMSYDAERGVLTWAVKLNNRAPVGAEAGCICKRRGYRVVRVDNVSYLAHRLIWLYVHGEWPCDEIDHVNGDKTDNRLVNLREASRAQNCRNIRRKVNKSGVTGVRWHAKTQKWNARIAVDRKRVSLGYFDRIEDAAEARKEAEVKYFGAFRRVV